MGKAGPLRWRDGRGWLVLVGGGKPENITHILRAAIEAMSDESPVVFVPTASAAPDGDHATSQRIITQIETLGGPVGYVAPIFTHTDATDLRNARRLAQAGLVYLGDGSAQQLVTALSDTPTLDALAAAYEAGAVVVAAGAAACALGAWGMCEQEIVGWGWLPDALICPHTTEASTLREAVKAHPECLGLGIPQDTALALGPDNQVQTLSASGQQVTVVLGYRFRS
jgi:cyanophycinase-like exopeptidase